MQNTTTFIIGIAFIAGCVGDPQDIPPNLQGDPVFKIDAEINGVLVSWRAGIDDYEHLVSHNADANGLVQYTSRFAKSVCPSAQCVGSIQFLFFDNNFNSETGSGVEATFIAGEKSWYSERLDEEVEISLIQQEGIATQQVALWTLNGVPAQNIGSASFRVHPNDFIDICLNTLDICRASYCFHTRAGMPATASLIADKTFGDFMLVEAIMEGMPPYNYQWSTGATTASTLVKLLDGGNRAAVGVTITDAQGAQAMMHESLLRSVSGSALCAGDVSFDVFTAATAFSQFSTVEIRYVDDQGVIYSTAFGDQQGASQFEILDMATYGEAPNGSDANQLEIKFNARLYNADGSESLEIRNAQGVVAISFN